MRDGGGERSGANGASGDEAKSSIKKINAEAIMAFMRTRECRRAIMGRYLNGKKT
jgi:hypothetical protein